MCSNTSPAGQQEARGRRSCPSMTAGIPEEPEHHHGNRLVHQPTTSQQEVFPWCYRTGHLSGYDAVT
ncbi:uncharacterized [Lates japonicus]